ISNYRTTSSLLTFLPSWAPSEQITCGEFFMQANPVLAQFVRGNWVENRHRGAFCLCDANGNIEVSMGDIERPVFPRSAIKAMQALPIFETDAVGKFSLDDEALGLACASHHGEEDHIAVAKKMLAAT